MRTSSGASPRECLGGARRAGRILGVATLLLAGCGTARRPSQPPGLPPALVAQARPIGRGARFHPPATGPVLGPCRSPLGPRVGVHVELFAANRVVLIPAGIGTRPPRSYSLGRISSARCYGDLVTLEPTGLVLLRPGANLLLSDLFRSWGQPLGSRALLSFAAPAGTHLSVYIRGRRWRGSPGSVPLARHAEIVVEVGPHVPPHSRYTFPPGA